MSYTDFFTRATHTEKQPGGLTPFPFQGRLAEEPWPEQGTADFRDGVAEIRVERTRASSAGTFAVANDRNRTLSLRP